MDWPKNRPCPSCRKNGRDRTSSHLFLHRSGKLWLCTRCGYTEPFENTDVKEYKIIKESVVKITPHSLPSLAIPDRSIRESTASHFGVVTSCSEETGEPEAHYYPITRKGELTAYKVRKLPKTFYTEGDMKGAVDLFGQSVCNSSGKKLLIVEGELDCLAAFQMLKDYAPQYNPAVVSLAKGAKDVNSIADNKDFINSFEEVILCLDMDEVGQESTESLAKLIGPKAKIMSISEKDACDMLVAGKQSEFINAFFKAKQYKPKGFVTVDDVFEKATAMPVWGKSWPWPSMTKLTYGRRLGEGIYFGAGVKVGKSEAVNQIAHHITQVEGGKIALFKLEEEPAMTVRKIAGKIMHKQFHVPDGNFTHEELVEGVSKVKGSVELYDSYGSTSWDELKEAIRYAVVVEGCQDIVIDPLTRLTVGMNPSEANTELERIADEISKMAKDLGFFYMFFCHLKAPLTGKPHEEGGKVHSNQFTGSRAMMRACYYMVGIERDKTLEDEIERNMSTFVLLEDRAFGNSGNFKVYYDKETGDYLEPNILKGYGDY